MQKMVLMMMALSSFKINHPMNIFMMVLSYTLIISMMSFMMTYSYWIMFITITTLIGGLMVIFMYMISLNPNEEKLYLYNPMMIMTLITWSNMKYKTNSSKMFLTEMYKVNYLSILIMMTLITLMIFSTTKLILSPFKNMKSTM